MKQLCGRFILVAAVGYVLLLLPQLDEVRSSNMSGNRKRREEKYFDTKHESSRNPLSPKGRKEQMRRH